MFVGFFPGCLAGGSSLEVCFQFPSHLLQAFFLETVISEAAVYFLLNYKAVVVKDFHRLGC